MMSRKQRFYMKKILCVCLALAVIVALMPQNTIKVSAETASNGYTTDSNGKMSYTSASRGYDFMGYVDGEWKQVTTTMVLLPPAIKEPD